MNLGGPSFWRGDSSMPGAGMDFDPDAARKLGPSSRAPALRRSSTATTNPIRLRAESRTPGGKAFVVSGPITVRASSNSPRRV